MVLSMAMITTTMLMGLGALTATAAAASAAPDGGPGLAEAWFHVFGRSHVLLVHFPIALIMVGAIYEIIAAIAGVGRHDDPTHRGSGPSRVALWIVLAGALAAMATAWSGWTYANFDFARDTSETLTWHRWIGVAAGITAGLCLGLGVIATAKHQRRLTNLYRVFLVAGAVLVGFAGHYGGVMVHGPDHVFGPLRGPTSTTPAPIEIDQQLPQVAVVSYLRDLRPLLEARCFKCHGPRRQRSNLRLDTRSGIFAVHDDLVIVAPNDPDGSEMVRRTSLPAEHDDRMPPDDPPLTEEQILLIRTWVEEGAVWGDEAIADAGSTADDTHAGADEPAHEPAVMITPLAIPELTDQQRAARDAAINALIDRGVIAQPIAADTDAVEVRFSLLGDQITDADLELLAGLETSLAWLDLAGTAITDEGVKTLAGFEQLRRVGLQRTALTDAGLAGLAALPHLEVLIAHSTQLTDAGIQTLRPVETLQRLYVWQTQVTKTGAAQLRAGRPTITVDLGE